MITAVDPDQARADAREILGDRRFSSDPAPRPLRGQLEWLGDRLRPVGDAIADVFDLLPWYVWLVVALGLIALAIRFVGPEVMRRWTSQRQAGAARPDRGRPVEDPDRLERDAAEAERRGDFDRAVRLRFRAGLLRLGRRGVIDYSPSTTVVEVRHNVRSVDFERLASTFEEVAYGDRDATQPDVDESRRDWPRVLDETGRR